MSNSNDDCEIVSKIQEPTDIDVLFGRGVATNRHVGNEKFRQLVHNLKEMYVTSTKKQKMNMSKNLVEQIRKEGGRFLERINDTGDGGGEDYYYVDVGNKKAIEKTSQALRDAAAPLRKKLVESGILQSVNNNAAKRKRKQQQRAKEAEELAAGGGFESGMSPLPSFSVSPEEPQQQAIKGRGHRKVQSNPVDFVKAHQEQQQQQQQQYYAGGTSEFQQQQQEEETLLPPIDSTTTMNDPMMIPATFSTPMSYEQRRQQRRHRRVQSEVISSSSSSCASSPYNSDIGGDFANNTTKSRTSTGTMATGRGSGVNDVAFLSAVFEMDNDDLMDDAMVFEFDSKEEEILLNNIDGVADVGVNGGVGGGIDGGAVDGVGVGDDKGIAGVDDTNKMEITPTSFKTSSSNAINTKATTTTTNKKKHSHRRTVSTPSSFNDNNFLNIIHQQNYTIDNNNNDTKPSSWQKQQQQQQPPPQVHVQQAEAVGEISAPSNGFHYEQQQQQQEHYPHHRRIHSTPYNFDFPQSLLQPSTTAAAAIETGTMPITTNSSSNNNNFNTTNETSTNISLLLENNAEELCSKLFDSNNKFNNNSRGGRGGRSSGSSIMSFDDEPLPI